MDEWVREGGDTRYITLTLGSGDGLAMGNYGWARRAVVYAGFVSRCMFVDLVVVVVLLLFCFLAVACWKRSTEYPYRRCIERIWICCLSHSSGRAENWEAGWVSSSP